MKVEFVSKNFTAPDKLKAVIEKKLDRLDKYFEDHDVKTKVMLKQNKERQTVEITIYAFHVIRSEVTGLNMYDIIDEILPKLERQIVKYRQKPYEKYKKNIRLEEREFFQDNIPDSQRSIIRTKQFELSPISADEAIEQLELLDHAFYVYLDKSSNAVSIAYRRNQGQYGVIETVVKK